MKPLSNALAVAWLFLAAVVSAAAPPNDNFAAATVMTGNHWLTFGTLFGATSESNEPILTGYPNGPTAWWRWQAPTSGYIRVRTWGSEGETMLAIYRGATLDTTRLITFGSSHADRANNAEANIEVTAGESYSIQVMGASYASPTFITDPFLPSRIQLSLVYAFVDAVPPNDKFANAVLISGPTADLIVNNAGAIRETGEPVDQPDALGNTVWVTWTAPSDGVWQLDAQEGDFDNITSVYTGQSVDTLTLLDFGDSDSSFGGNPYVGGGHVNFAAKAGQKYHFQVQGAALAGADYQFGNVRLLLRPVQPPANDDFANATVLTGNEPIADGWTTSAYREPGEPKARVDEGPSIWWKWTAPTAGLLAVIEYEGTMDAYVGTTLANLVPPPRAPNPVTRGSLFGVTDWFSVTAGQTICLRGTGSSERIRFSLRMGLAPANDDFANRKLLSGAATSDTVDMEFSSWEQDEPGTDSVGPKSVWYHWVAPSTGRYIISSRGSAGFTRIVVFTGTALATLVETGEEILGYSPATYGRVELDAVAGTDYTIKLQGESLEPGLARVDIRQPSRPANDDFAQAVTMSGASWSTTGVTTDGTAEPDEPSPVLSGGGAGFSVWWRWTAPSSGLVRATTAGSAISTVLAVYTGATLGTLLSVAFDQDNGWNATGAVNFTAVAGTTYYFQVDAQGRQEGVVNLALAPASRPSNDNFADRLALATNGSVAAGTVSGATTEAGEPTIPGAQGGHSVWFEWTAPAGGTAFFRVTAASFDPAFGLYLGGSLAALTPNVTGGSGQPSQNGATFLVAYPVNKGTKYEIRVDGNPGDDGDFLVSVSMPPPSSNDAFAARAVVAGAVVHTVANNEGATSEAGEPAHAGAAARHSIWWEWTAPSTGPVGMDTIGSTAQARFAVYTGNALNALVPVASATVPFPSGSSAVSFPATAGTRYLIAADTGDRSRGDVALNIVASSAVPANDNFASATRWKEDQEEELVRPIGATAEPGEPAHGGRAAVRSLWWAWTPRTTRRALVWQETEKEGFGARIAIYKGTSLANLIPLSAVSYDGHFSRLGVDVLAGQTYYIALDTPSASPDPGWIKIGIAPINGTLAGAIPISPADGLLEIDTLGATNEDPAQAPTALRQLWWTWIPEVNARMEWRVLAAPGDDVDLSVGSPDAFYGTIAGAVAGHLVPQTGEVIGTFDAVAGNLYYLKAITRKPQTLAVRLAEVVRLVPPSNDQQYRAKEMAGAAWTYAFTLGAESGDQLFWNWTATAAGVAEVRLTGDLADDDALFAYADGNLKMTAGTSHSNGGPPVIRVRSTPGQRWVFVTRSELRRARPAILALVSPAPGTPPANDSWTAAEVLGPSWTSVTNDVTFASCEPGEPDHSSSGGTRVATQLPPGRSVWYRWTPTETGVVEFRLESEVALALQIYSGRSQAAWQVEAFLQPGQRSLPVYLLAGREYHIAVATRPYDERTASFVLHRGAAAPNDLLAGATSLNGPVVSSRADSVGATVETGEPGNGFNFEKTRASLWWKWTAPATGFAWMDTRGSEFPTILAVFASDPPDETARVAEAHAALTAASLGTQPGFNAAAVVFTAAAGQLYMIRISHADTNEPAGFARLNISMTAPTTPYAQWLAGYPTLTGAAAADTADPDGDGLGNLAELAFGGNPLQSDADRGKLRVRAVEGGYEIEASLDRDALDALFEGAGIETEWQVSSDLKQWQPGPIPRFIRRDGRFSVEGITLTPNDPPFARLHIRLTP